ncbi:hypothetical protein [Flavihumibacter profundi]|uniref:hypothetical protein n=1 Tax=Flavihumibacter profundi TaxID=2716883 RepID=UPI001CC431BA|nr:hypothetical protein [Flavihumibacter profundi]MBZ5859448.1 hypothetical protein [Flavihumibacter profundi]
MKKKNGRAILLDYLIPLDITILNKEIGLKAIGRRKKGITLYTTNPITGNKELAASMQISVNIDTNTDNDYAEVKFSIKGRPITQSIKLVAKKAPIGKGVVYYFKCPITGSLRRKLYLYEGRFVSKLAINNPHYLSQIQSSTERNTSKELKQLIRLQNTAKQVTRKYFKVYYAGNLTKRYMRSMHANDSLKGLW